MLISRIANKVKTPYRRINHPQISREAIVIDIGCGPNPNPRANVACDFLEDDTERAAALVIDRPFVWAEINALPFRDKAFDYSILAHVLEHLGDPAGALGEVERVSKAGYIETPNAITEIAVSYVFHLSRVTVIDRKLIITFKRSWNEELPPAFADVTADIKKAIAFIMEVDWCRSITQYRWQNHIDFEIRGTMGGFSKQGSDSDAKVPGPGALKRMVVAAVYRLMRPKLVVLEDYLASPCCKAGLHADQKPGNELQCQSCKRRFGKTRGHWDFRIPR